METMELCVTACEKFSNNNEVLPLVQAPLLPLVTPWVNQVPPSAQPAPEGPAGQARACVAGEGR